MYMDLVSVERHGVNKLYRAPWASPIYPGDEVIVETRFEGEQRAKVVECVSTDTDSQMFKFVLAQTGAKEPLMKVLKKVSYRDFEYDDKAERVEALKKEIERLEGEEK